MGKRRENGVQDYSNLLVIIVIAPTISNAP